MNDIELKEQGARELERVFEGAKYKYLDRCSKPGNTIMPWNVFSIEWLEKRLDDEIQEYKESKRATELLDIINIAGFLHIARLNDAAKKLPEDFLGRGR